MSAPTPAERREWAEGLHALGKSALNTPTGMLRLPATDVLLLAAAVRDLADENERLRQSMWDALMALGFDTDGDPTPDALVHPRLGDLLVQEAQQFRKDVDESDEQFNALERALNDEVAERDALREQIERLRFPIGEGHYRGLDWDDPERAPFCGNCMEMWPCPAARAALTEDQP